MPTYLVAIAEVPGCPRGELGTWLRDELADAGFTQIAELAYRHAAWEDEQPEHESSPFRRILYRYEAENEGQALVEAREIVGDAFHIKVVPMLSN